MKWTVNQVDFNWNSGVMVFFWMIAKRGKWKVEGSAGGLMRKIKRGFEIETKRLKDLAG